MSLPKFHSCTWSDDKRPGSNHREALGPAPAGPESLRDKELHLWVTYPETGQKKKKNGKKAKSGRTAPKLWAVMIVEELRQAGGFAYEVTLKSILKTGDRTITIWVKNDPADLSDEAEVFGWVSPHPDRLTPLERQLSHIAGKRVFDAISETWCRTAPPADSCGAMTSTALPAQ